MEPSVQLYPTTFAEKFDFNEVVSLISQKCASEGAKLLVESLMPIYDQELLEIKFEYAAEALNAVVAGKSPIIQPIPHITPYINKILIQGAMLSEFELYSILKLLLQWKAIFSYLVAEKNTFPKTIADFEKTSFPEPIFKEIQKIFNEEGKIHENATPELSLLHKKQQQARNEVRKKIDAVLRNAKQQGWINTDIQPSIREGRLVIPIQAEFKRNIQGIIHDESATGQTVYIEPANLVELNNQIKEIELLIIREIRKILLDKTALLSPYKSAFEAIHHCLIQFDFRIAVAMFSKDIKASVVKIGSPEAFALIDARHPLLHLKLEKVKKAVVPFSIAHTNDNRITVVSGPNAGGKSVLLKALGLIQYMFQCGLPIPAKDHSVLPLYHCFLAEIGDEQSIENDLSTYSSHMKHMVEFLRLSGAKTLFLIDEFGTGTDPLLGGPIAEAILTELLNKGAYGIVNTHYSNLKNFAANNIGVQNAAMGFDATTLEPLFTFSIGLPGSSFALEIAQKMGIPAHVLQRALSKMESQQHKVEQLLADIDQQKAQIEKSKTLHQAKDDLLTQLIEEHQAKNELQKEKIAKEWVKTKQKTEELIAQTKIQMQLLLKEAKKQKSDTAFINKEIEKVVQQVKLEMGANAPALPPKNHKIPEIGDNVTLENSNQTGIVAILKDKQALVEVGDLKLWLPINMLQVKKKDIKNVKPKPISGNSQNVVSDTIEGFIPDVDVRGFRTEEALKAVEQLLDKAVVAGYLNLRILHGKGNGILRNQIRNYLKSYKFVQQIQSENPDLGGEGITLVKLKH